jgi:hypothetical protein
MFSFCSCASVHPPRFLPIHRLSDWPDCYLEVHCCKGIVQMPVRMLIERYGNLTFGDVLKQLRCGKCHRKAPAPVYLCASHHKGFMGGPAPDWNIVIAPPRILR